MAEELRLMRAEIDVAAIHFVKDVGSRVTENE